MVDVEDQLNKKRFQSKIPWMINKFMSALGFQHTPKKISIYGEMNTNILKLIKWKVTLQKPLGR